MEQPNFLFEEFVDNNILNTAFAQTLTSIREFPSISQLFIPGLINPNSLNFGFNSNLVVTVTAPNIGANIFRCLFSSGALTAAHGIITGADTDIYNIDLTGFVPGVGSAVVYLVAQYTTIQLDSVVILGAPPGHPDYSANFLPYVGYTRLQDTLNIFATLTPPDNQTTMELARTTLTAGQTVVSTVDTSHQIDAALNINLSSIILSGDVTGPANGNIVQQSSAPTFFANDINASGRIHGGTLNVASTADFFGAVNASGMVTVGSLLATGLFGVISETIVGAIGDIDSQAGNINALTGNVTAAGSVIAGGEVFGSDATQGGAAIMLNQLLGNSFQLIGPNSTAHFTVPIWTGSVVQKVVIQFGSYQPAGPAFVPPNSVSTINFPIAFPGLIGMVLCNPMGGDPTSPPGSIVNFPNNNSFQWHQGPVGAIALYWLAIGN